MTPPLGHCTAASPLAHSAQLKFRSEKRAQGPCQADSKGCLQEMVGKDHPQVMDKGGKPHLQLLFHVSAAFRPGILTVRPPELTLEALSPDGYACAA